MSNVVFVNDQGTRCAKHDLRGNMFERAQNVKDSYVESKHVFSSMYVALDWMSITVAIVLFSK